MDTKQHKTHANDRVGMFLNPHTRNRLNKLKADLSLETGATYSQDDVVKLLLDHYELTAPEPVRELA